MKLILGNRAMRKYLLIAITVFCSFFLLIRINQPACVIDSRSEYFTAQVCLFSITFYILNLKSRRTREVLGLQDSSPFKTFLNFLKFSISPALNFELTMVIQIRNCFDFEEYWKLSMNENFSGQKLASVYLVNTVYTTQSFFVWSLLFLLKKF